MSSSDSQLFSIVTTAAEEQNSNDKQVDTSNNEDHHLIADKPVKPTSSRRSSIVQLHLLHTQLIQDQKLVNSRNNSTSPRTPVTNEDEQEISHRTISTIVTEKTLIVPTIEFLLDKHEEIKKTMEQERQKIVKKLQVNVALIGI